MGYRPWMFGFAREEQEPAKVSRPRRDRSKVKAGRKAARRNR